MHPIVITNCTARKATVVGPRKTLGIDGYDRLDHAAGTWHTALSDASLRVKAETLYMGRSIVEAKRAANECNGHLWFVSAGLGLVAANELVPSYDLTISAGAGSISSMLDRLEGTPADWWRHLNAAKGDETPLARLLAVSRTSRVLLALPSTYLPMVEEDLLSTPRSALAKLRIFTSAAGASALDKRLGSYVMPYDDRLDSPTSRHAGTRAEYPQRAMRHFVEVLRGTSLPLSEAKAAVARSLADLSPRVRVVRRTCSDEELIEELARRWAAFDGRSGRLLRYLRDEALIACEQGRFQRLWHQCAERLARER